MERERERAYECMFPEGAESQSVHDIVFFVQVLLLLSRAREQDVKVRDLTPPLATAKQANAEFTRRNFLPDFSSRQ